MADVPNITDRRRWLEQRQKARTSLHYLCHVLGYRDVCRAVHGEMMDALQKFSGGEDSPRILAGEKLNTVYLVEEYRPATPVLYDLEGHRQVMQLIARGHLKSTIITIAHNIQWLLNYPNIRIRLHAATAKQVEGFYRELRAHFIVGAAFRNLFPEYCPVGKRSGKVEDFGNMEGFDTLACRRPSKERNVSISSAESVLSSTHHEVVSIDDIVDDANSRTPGEIDRIKRNFALLDPLVERGKRSNGEASMGWMKVAGTIYSFSDLHYETWQKEESKPVSERKWFFLVRSAAPNYPKGPTLWPDRWPIEALQAIEDDPTKGPGMLYPQYLMQPKSDKQGLVTDRDQIRWMPRKAFDEYYGYIQPYVTVDLNGMEPQKEGSDTDFACVNAHGFGADGNLYVFDCMYSRDVNPDDVIDYMFWLYAKHPRIASFKIEKEAHARVLLPFLKKEMAKRNVYLPIMEIQRDSKVSKQQRIKGLQPWFAKKNIVMVEGLGFTNPKTGAWESIKKSIEDEILFFPRYNHDDFLDTLADAMQGRDGTVVSDMIPRPKMPPVISPWMPLGQINGEQRWAHYGSMPIAMIPGLGPLEEDGY